MLRNGTLIPKKKGVKSYFLSEAWKQEAKKTKLDLSKAPSIEEKLCPKEKMIRKWLLGE